MGFHHMEDELPFSDNEYESCPEQYDSDNDSVYTDDDIPVSERSFIDDARPPVYPTYFELASIASGCTTFFEARDMYKKEAMELQKQTELERQEQEKEALQKKKNGGLTAQVLKEIP